MAEFLQLHTHNLDARVIKKAVQVLLKGGVIVYPTDSTYALGCRIGDKPALERIRRIRQLDSRPSFVVLCPRYRFTQKLTIVSTASLKPILPDHTPSFSRLQRRCRGASCIRNEKRLD